MSKTYHNILSIVLFSAFATGLSACLSSSDSDKSSTVEPDKSPVVFSQSQAIETPHEVFLRMNGNIGKTDTFILKQHLQKDVLPSTKAEELRQKIQQMRDRLSG